MNARLEKRGKEIRARALIRRREYRERNLANGVWFRVRHFLVFAAEAYVAPHEEVERLLAEGHIPDPAGFDLEPPKVLLRIPRERLALIPGVRRIPISLGPEFLQAAAVLTVGFDLANGD